MWGSDDAKWNRPLKFDRHYQLGKDVISAGGNIKVKSRLKLWNRRVFFLHNSMQWLNEHKKISSTFQAIMNSKAPSQIGKRQLSQSSAHFHHHKNELAEEKKNRKSTNNPYVDTLSASGGGARLVQEVLGCVLHTDVSSASNTLSFCQNLNWSDG